MVEPLVIDVDDRTEDGSLTSNISVQNEGPKESTQNRRVHSEYFAEMETKLTKSKAGPFTLGRVLGKGVTGTVYEGTHMLTNFKVALKVIKKKSFLKTSHRWKSLRREIAIMKLMDHPNVLKLYDVFETQDKIFLVTEYAKGGDLFSYVLQGPLRPEEALRMLAQVIMGIQHCHEHCIVHRDLKLENLLLDDDKNVKIADFGMARMAKAGRTLSTICGSPHYASPEVLKGGKYDGKVSDVWSLGVILFAMATGGLPFDDESMPKLFRRIYRGEFAIPSTVDGNISDLIRKMIVVDCKERIKMEDIQHHKAFNQTEFFARNMTLSEAQDRIREIGAIDEVVFEDLMAILGSSDLHREEVKSRIISVTGTPEKVLYLLLSKRKHHRIQQLTQLSPRPSPRGKPTGGFFGSPSSASPAVPSSPSYSSDMEPRTSPPTLERIPSEDPPPLSISALDIGKGEEVSLEKLGGRPTARVDSASSSSRDGGAKVTAFYISGQSERLLPSSFSPSSFATQKKTGFFAPPLAPQIPPSSELSPSSVEPSVALSSSAPNTRRQSVVTDLPAFSSSSSSASSPSLSSSLSLSSLSSTSPSLSSSISSPSPPPAPSLSPLPTLSYTTLSSPPLPAVSSVSLSVATYPQSLPVSLQASPPRPLQSNPSLSSSSSISSTVLSPSSPSPPPMPFLPATSFSSPHPLPQSISSSASSLSDGVPASPETTPPSSPFNYVRSPGSGQSRGATSPSVERHFHPHQSGSSGSIGSGGGRISRYKAAKSPSPTHMNRVSLSPHSGRYQHGIHAYPIESGRISPLPSFPEEGRLSPHPEIPASGSRRKGSAPLMINSNLVQQNMKAGPVRKGSFPRNSDSVITPSTPEVTPRDDEIATPSSAPPSRRASSGTLKTAAASSTETRETTRAGNPGRTRSGSRKGFSKHVDTGFRDDSGTYVGRAFTSDSSKPAYVSYSVPSSPTAPQSPEAPTSPTVTLGPDRAHHWFKEIFVRRPSLDPWRAPPSHPPAYTSPEDELASPYVPRTNQHHQLPQDPPLYPRAASTNIPARQSRSPTRARKKFTEQRHRMMRYFRMTSPAALQTALTGTGGGAGGSSAPTTALSPTGLQPPVVGPSVPSIAPRALSPTRFRATSPRLTTTTEPSGVKSGITSSPQRSAINSPMHKIRSSGNIRNLQSPDHKLTNS